jgi:hypothetical protein
MEHIEKMSKEDEIELRKRRYLLGFVRVAARTYMYRLNNFQGYVRIWN